MTSQCVVSLNMHVGGLVLSAKSSLLTLKPSSEFFDNISSGVQWACNILICNHSHSAPAGQCVPTEAKPLKLSATLVSCCVTALCSLWAVDRAGNSIFYRYPNAHNTTQPNTHYVFPLVCCPFIYLLCFLIFSPFSFPPLYHSHPPHLSAVELLNDTCTDVNNKIK